MKKMRSLAAILTASVLSMGVPGNMLHVDAGYCAITPDKMLESLPEYSMGYFEPMDTDYGLYSAQYEEGTYIPFRYANVPGGFMMLDNFRVNYVILNLRSDSDWESIYEKYKDTIDADYESIDYTPNSFRLNDKLYSSNEYNKVVLYDIPEIKSNNHAEGKLTDCIQYESKANLIAQMCEEMKASGMIISGEYRDYYAEMHSGQFTTYYDMTGENTGIFMPLEIYSQSIDLDFLQSVAAQFGKELVVTECVDEENQKYYEISQIDDADIIYAIGKQVREYDPDSEMSMETILGLSFEGLGVDVDILTGTPAPSVPIYGDIDQDGVLSIEDAVEALCIYAKQAASLGIDTYTDDQIIAADADSSGVVDVNDASVILNYYAKNAAGLNPTWNDVLTE